MPPTLFILLYFTFSRAIFYSLGIRFYSDNLLCQWHFLPVELLKTDLLRSLWLLHSQPPLFNLFLGIGVKYFSHPTPFFQATFLLMSFFLLYMMFRFLDELAVNRRWNLFFVFLFGLNPSLILYENVLFYPLWEAFFLVGSSLGLLLYARSQYSRPKPLILVGLCTTALILTRASFHPIWAFGWGCLLLVFLKIHRKRLPFSHLAILLFPWVVGTAWMVKNLLLIGDFSLSSALGMGTIKNALLYADNKTVRSLLAGGQISPLAMRAPFEPISAYRDLLPQRKPTGFAILDAEKKEAGCPNPNHKDYVTISKQMFHDSITIIQRNPKAYLFTLIDSIAYFASPGTTLHPTGVNLGSIRWLEKIYSTILFPMGRPDFFLFIFTSLLFFSGMTAFFLLSRNREKDSGIAFPILFIFLTEIYLSLICCLLEVGENFRVRFCLNPLLFLSVFLLVARANIAAIQDPNGCNGIRRLLLRLWLNLKNGFWDLTKKQSA